MKVKYASSHNEEVNISKDKIYYVIAIEFDNTGSMSGDYIKYRIMNDINQVIPYSAKYFDVVSGKLSTEWVYNFRSSNNYSILSKELTYPQFWEGFYNDDAKALDLFKGCYQRIIIEEASSDEIKKILDSGNEYEIGLVLRGLGKIKNDDYRDEIIEKVEGEMSLFRAYSGMKASPVLIEYFNYLSEIGGDKVDELFIAYYENIEWQCEELDFIVNDFYYRK